MELCEQLLLEYSEEEMNALLMRVSSPLLSWYDANARVLPWRSEATPYRVWVSEIMLQQTRVSAVLPYFNRFIEALPDVFALAAADEETLLKLWEGLGYYNRARNLQKAARILTETHGGIFPSDYESLLSLPGVGEYTAGAIASIAFGQAVPAVDGNVQRVLSRLLQSFAEITDSKKKTAFWRAALRMIPPFRAGDFNQALMELGAVICLPNGSPRCGECPLADFCRAHAAGCEEELPVRAAKKQRKTEEKTVLLVLSQGKVLLHKREKGLLGGLWEYLLLSGLLPGEEVRSALSELGFKTDRLILLPQAHHVFTHVEWKMQGFAAFVQKEEDLPGCIWAKEDEVRSLYALPGAFTAYTRMLPSLLREGKKQNHPFCENGMA